MAKHKLTIVDNGLIDKMRANSNFLVAFPFLRTVGNARVVTGGGGKCGGCSRSAAFTDYNTIKLALNALNASDKIRLKALLEADQVRLVFRKGKSVVTANF